MKSTLLPTWTSRNLKRKRKSPPPKREEAEPAPKKEKKKKAKRTDRLTDKAALDAKLKEDNWQITEKPRPTKEGGKPVATVDKYYEKPGESSNIDRCWKLLATTRVFNSSEPRAPRRKNRKRKKKRGPRSSSSAKPEEA